MKVITLDIESLDSICKNLTKQVMESKYQPDLILGIESGGSKIAEKIYVDLDYKNVNINYCEPIKIKTDKKKNKLNKILKLLPIFILDYLRIFEAKFLFNKNNRGNFSEIKFPNDINTYNSILVVDDAIDSGETISAVVNSLRLLNPKAQIRTAVLTITKDSPTYLPDYYIYHNQTLLRFPWSIDAK